MEHLSCQTLLDNLFEISRLIAMIRLYAKDRAQILNFRNNRPDSLHLPVITTYDPAPVITAFFPSKSAFVLSDSAGAEWNVQTRIFVLNFFFELAGNHTAHLAFCCNEKQNNDNRMCSAANILLSSILFEYFRQQKHAHQGLAWSLRTQQNQRKFASKSRQYWPTQKLRYHVR